MMPLSAAPRCAEAVSITATFTVLETARTRLVAVKV